MLYLGKEEENEFQQEMSKIIPVIDKLIETKKLQVGEQVYTIQPLLCCDMKALVMLLGLYEVYRSNTTWRCAWCEVRYLVVG